MNLLKIKCNLGCRFQHPFVAIFSGGCSHSDHLVQTSQYVASLGIVKKIISTDTFDVVTFHNGNLINKRLKIYIEGDGKAWNTRYTPSSNPTPKNPVALKAMVKDEYPNKLYIARPCQYQKTGSRNCIRMYWTEKRFSQEIIDSTNIKMSKAKEFTNGMKNSISSN